jgi:hypothetical protein
MIVRFGSRVFLCTAARLGAPALCCVDQDRYLIQGLQGWCRAAMRLLLQAYSYKPSRSLSQVTAALGLREESGASFLGMGTRPF